MNHYTCTSDVNGKEEAFRLMLHNICQRLDKSCLESMKYQCRDYIGRGKLEKVLTFLELFTVLEERDIVSCDDVDFLMSCLSCISRKDLVKLVKQYSSHWLVPREQARTRLYGRPIWENDQQIGYEHYKSTSGLEPSKVSVSSVHETNEQPDDKAIPVSEGGFANPPQHNAQLHQLTAFQVRLIDFISNNLSVNWQATARFLGVPDDVISASHYNWPHDLRRQIFETLAEHARSGGHLSRESVLEALMLSGRYDVAQRLSALQL